MAWQLENEVGSPAFTRLRSRVQGAGHPRSEDVDSGFQSLERVRRQVGTLRRLRRFLVGRRSPWAGYESGGADFAVDGAADRVADDAIGAAGQSVVDMSFAVVAVVETRSHERSLERVLNACRPRGQRPTTLRSSRFIRA
jgi:hypothetical protein